MKVIIAGSRTIEPIEVLPYFLKAIKTITISEIVCGEARGVDLAGRCIGETFNIHVASFPADWKQYGMAAGPIRNRQIAEYADALILIWDGKSSGSANMKSEMQRLSKPIMEFIV